VALEEASKHDILPPAATEGKEIRSLEDIKADWRFVVMEGGDGTIGIFPKYWLKREEWLTIHNLVKSMGGAWSRYNHMWVIPPRGVDVHEIIDNEEED